MFWKISGLTEIDSTFYISIGTNTLVNFICVSILLSYIPTSMKFSKKHNTEVFSNICATYLLHSQFMLKIFYENKIFGLKLRKKYLLIFIPLFFQLSLYYKYVFARLHESINLIPILFLLILFSVVLIQVLSSFHKVILFLFYIYKSANKMLLKIYVLFIVSGC